MKTTRATSKSLALLLSSSALVALCACNSNTTETNTEAYLYQLEPKNYYTNLLCQTTYQHDSVDFETTYYFADERLYDIRTHFCLDTLIRSDESTYIKAVKIQRFVSDNLPHGNPQGMPEANNAIGLWAFAQQPGVQLNCRQHSMVLRDLLLSVGIKARYVTCLSCNPDDTDCHVVNEFYVPEFEKWVMIDSDMDAIVTDTCGIPLSLAELRTYLAHNEPYLINGKPNEGQYYDAYMAKNCYWFAMHEKSIVDDETQHVEGDRMLVLAPAGFDQFVYSDPVVTTDSERFWK